MLFCVVLIMASFHVNCRNISNAVTTLPFFYGICMMKGGKKDQILLFQVILF